MEWNKIFITGITQIDEQHKGLFDMISELKKAMKHSNVDNSEIRRILVSLVDYTKFHFSYEEQFMEDNNYSEIKEHKIIHRKFILELKNIIIKYNTDGTYTDVKLYIFLIKWLQQHIAVEDQKYVKKLK